MAKGFPDYQPSTAPGFSGTAKSYIKYAENTSTSNTEQTLLTITGKGILKQFTINISSNAASAAFIRVYVDSESTPSFEIDYDSILNTIGAETTFNSAWYGVPYFAATTKSMWFAVDIRFESSFSIRVFPNTALSQSHYTLVQYLLFV